MSIDAVKKSRRGRPAIDSEAVTVRLERSALAVIDEWRDAQPDQPGRPEAIRRLAAAGLAARPILDALLVLLEGQKDAGSADLRRLVAQLKAGVGEAVPRQSGEKA